MNIFNLTLMVLFIGIIVVISVLAILIIIIKEYGGLTNLLSNKSEPNVTIKKYNHQKERKNNEINKQIVAVISAAVYSLSDFQNTRYKIIEIKKEK